MNHDHHTEYNFYQKLLKKLCISKIKRSKYLRGTK